MNTKKMKRYTKEQKIHMQNFKRDFKNLLSAYLKKCGLKHFKLRDGESNTNNKPNWNTLRIYTKSQKWNVINNIKKFGFNINIRLDKYDNDMFVITLTRQ